MAAEVDFGDLELFEAFDHPEDSIPKPVHTRFKDDDGDEEDEHGAGDAELRERLRQCEETIEQLRAENQQLKRKLNILTRPSGILVNNTKLDGPLLQILFMNNVISKQYHQEIEEFVSNLVKRFEEQQKNDVEKTSFNLLPQPSSVMLEEDHKVEESCAIENNKEAFSVVGSVLYFTNFCLDKLGQPLLNENPQLTEGWEIPKYQQVFSHIVSLEGQEIQVKAKRPKPHCFNCGSEEHQMKDCPMPRNAARISEKRKEYMDACSETNSQNFQQRYHAEEVEERFGRFKPGVISEELQDALGLTDKSLPPFIYRMRQLGYPPGWLKEAELENSGLALYDGKDGADGEAEAGETQQNKSVTYDLSKLVNYPGFNISTPRGIPDEWRMFGSIPMQACQQKDVFANYLTSNFQAPSLRSGSKRSSSQSSPSSPKKQKKESSSGASPADMELDSDAEVPHSSPSGAFQFQPPLPPGTPPPLPQGTPPPIFTPPLPKGTPPLTPSDSPQTRAASAAMDEDSLTLEELEEQQRRIWAALEQAESVNSDSDIPVDTPLTGNSVVSSPCPHELDLPVPEGKPSEKQRPEEPEEPEGPDVCTKKLEVEHSLSPDSEPPLLCQEEEEESVQIDSKDALDNGNGVSNCDVSNGGSQKLLHVDTSPSTATKIHSPVPDMSKFATGITPFEFENMAESTGMYLRIRNLLKNSPRNQQKNKKASE
ncbi:zinc finger CCHC domain-containing protein 8 isoform X2 [Canis lupus baileyi]|uniref:Zinc finger CCHC domain-containing protein 8 n=2 Tax=Canis lupus familiaris TaxID=9615 RepID=A0A8C0Z6N5_CANLF|nr:zinc finger CCHC domain-containing protein 8 isoform X3 [Canis lupus dingo]XP_038292438.1 zinc finger CCHC domain-containing protein 8 isoform X3 [Canis lupus familiaris]XP_038430847.1 zinc finger CCHC domain-containing protein 8 isoform X3 [Canis lupus familiaris]XP_534658.1 zinc finger CCHC domain-containing protein 8 isoform X3 [Canis lupus familiaris]|eukprot:XP_534658.1 zinc finger CCHC domain-containing protein 8 isoform X1 [Canis lupus familiaris]